jgi:cysteine desulfurase
MTSGIVGESSRMKRFARRRVHRGVGSYIGTAVQLAIGRNLGLFLSMSERLYLDHAATSPLLPEAREAMSHALETWANPSSPHADGRRARAAFEDARRAIAEALGWRHDVIFTCGASEAIQAVAERAKLKRRIVGPTEHDAVIAAMGKEAEQIGVDGSGLIDLAALEKTLDEPALIAIQLVNNETGCIQSIGQIYDLVRASGSLLLCDCAQAAGKIELPEADFIAVSGHKFGGPPGVGVLLVKDRGTLEPSGGQEQGYRRGTENLPAAAAMAAALKSRAFSNAMSRLASLRQYLEGEILASGGTIIASGAPRIATIGAYSMPRLESSSQLVQLDLAGISVSAGSACSSGSMKPSRVLAAMGVPKEIAASVIRVSFGPSTSRTDVDRFLAEWRKIGNRAKAVAA